MLLFWTLAREHRRMRLEVHESKARRLRDKVTGEEIELKPVPKRHFHLFLSHVVSTR